MVSCHSPCFVRETVTIYNVNVQRCKVQLIQLCYYSQVGFLFFFFYFYIRFYREILPLSVKRLFTSYCRFLKRKFQKQCTKTGIPANINGINIRNIIASIKFVEGVQFTRSRPPKNTPERNNS